MKTPAKKTATPASASRGTVAPAAAAVTPLTTRDPALYAKWLIQWQRAGTRDLAAARLLVARCNGNLNWLASTSAEPLAVALLDAYDAYPELAGDHPTWALADAIAAAPSDGPEQTLSNATIARRIDPATERTLAVLIAGRKLVRPSVYLAEISQWLDSRPPQSHRTRLLRRLAEDAPTPDTLEIIGHLAGHGADQAALSTTLVARFGEQLAQTWEEGGTPPPSGAVLVRSRRAVDAVTREATHANGPPTDAILERTLDLRSRIERAGYKPRLASRGRFIDNPSWLGVWSDYVLRSGAGFLRANYFSSETGKLEPADGSLTSDAAAPYRLAGTLAGELPRGHFRLTFTGRVEADTHLVCEASGYTGRREHHRFAVSSQTIRPTDDETVFGVLEFALDERASDVTLVLDIERSQGAVQFCGVEFERLDR